MWIDTHCHLDAPEFDTDRDAVRQQAAQAGVGHVVIPAVARAHWPQVMALAERHGDSYALGIHPLYTPAAQESDIAALHAMLAERRHDPRLVAVGEIGLDFFAAGPPQGKEQPPLGAASHTQWASVGGMPAAGPPQGKEQPPRGAASHTQRASVRALPVHGLDAARQTWFYEQQIALAREFDLPVILHVRKSSDQLLKVLRATPVVGGIAHAFNGSAQQAQAFIDLGFKLGFGGAVTYDRALKLRALAATLPLASLVLETDAPDIPPHWLYTTAEQRAAGQPQGRNTSAELPRIAAVVAQLRGMALQDLQAATTANARAALRGLKGFAA